MRPLPLLATLALSCLALPAQAAPEAWFFLSAQKAYYRVGADLVQPGGQPATLLETVYRLPHQKDTAELVRHVEARPYRGKRVRFSAWIRLGDVSQGARLVASTGTKQAQKVTLDPTRQSRGTQPWRRAEIVFDVPKDATYMTVGAIMQGNGEMALGAASVAVVGHDVPLTPKAELGKEPQDLDLEPLAQ